MIDWHSRRAFLRAATAAGVAWAAADLDAVEDALRGAAEQQKAGRDSGTARFESLTRAQAAVLEAMAARILPAADGRPGAREAGAVFFIDRALATFNASSHLMYTTGVSDLDQRARRAWPDQAGFVALTAARQDALLRVIQPFPFFQAVRFDTIVGTFGLPAWGGNRAFAGWHLIGLDHQPAFAPPFGDYDADERRRS